jgi:zinc/manganese transport system substrate-binding protein
MRLLLLLLPLGLFAQLNIAVSYPYIGVLTKEIGGKNINTIVLAKGNWDPHFIVPRPSLISKVRNADGLIMNGAQLEIGWLPPLMKRASNPKIKMNSATFLNLSHHVALISKPKNFTREGGDIHPDGNPHFNLDPKNILILANVIKEYLSLIDSKNAKNYTNNYDKFRNVWEKKMLEWDLRMQSKKGTKIIQYHDVLGYFIKAYGLQSVGNIEPLPGIPPSSKHTFNLIELIKKEKVVYIVHDVYHSMKTAEYISSKTDIPIILMPHDVQSLNSIGNLVSLFDYLTSAIK